MRRSVPCGEELLERLVERSPGRATPPDDARRQPAREPRARRGGCAAAGSAAAAAGSARGGVGCGGRLAAAGSRSRGRCGCRSGSGAGAVRGSGRRAAAGPGGWRRHSRCGHRSGDRRRLHDHRRRLRQVHRSGEAAPCPAGRGRRGRRAPFFILREPRRVAHVRATTRDDEQRARAIPLSHAEPVDPAARVPLRRTVVGRDRGSARSADARGARGRRRAHPASTRDDPPGASPSGGILATRRPARQPTEAARSESRRGDSNPRPTTYEAVALPLSYSGGCERVYPDGVQAPRRKPRAGHPGQSRTRDLGIMRRMGIELAGRRRQSRRWSGPTDRRRPRRRSAGRPRSRRRYGAELHLVQVAIPTSPTDTEFGAAERDPGGRRPPSDLQQRGASGSPADRGRAHVAIDDDPAMAIVRCGRRAPRSTCSSSGNAGMAGRKEFLLGNVPNRISHNARCTVIIVNTTDGVPTAVPATRGASAPSASAVETQTQPHLMARGSHDRRPSSPSTG